MGNSIFQCKYWDLSPCQSTLHGLLSHITKELCIILDFYHLLFLILLLVSFIFG